MNRKLKHKIVITTVITAFCVIGSLSSVNIDTKAAYAATYELNDLSMETSGGSSLELYENDNYTKELDSGQRIESTYYAKLSSDTSKVKFNTSGYSGDIKIFKERSTKVYDSSDDITILTGKTTLYIRLYDIYNQDSPDDYKKQYKIVIKRYTSAEEEQIRNDNQGNIYLKALELDYGDIPLGFDRLKTEYNAKVDFDIKSIAVRAEPEDGATTVKINNLTVDENDDYKKMVNLDKGNNKIEITLSQDYEDKRTYIINVNRAETSVATTDNETSNTGAANGETQATTDDSQNKTNNENNVVNTDTPNKWIQVMGKWKYNDSYGKPIKSTWFYDNYYGKNYYFDSDGNMVIGWIVLNNNWYYLNANGDMAIGWKQVGSNWYYLDYDGKMKTGWFKDGDGKYYYLYDNGAMARDTKISGYKLGSNGAWIK